MKLILAWLLFLPALASAKTVHYELTITRGSVNLSGKKQVDFALLVNGGIPAPTLEFTEGDEAEIVVRNGLSGDEEVSTHWHGLLLPPSEDGVAYVNTPPIFPGGEHTFRFPIRQSGTFWYHSHTMLQEQEGVYGAFIIHPKKEKITADKEAVVILSDWSDEDPDQIIKNLRKDGNYYLYKKNSVRSYLGAVRAGGLGTMLKNEWDRMGGMDLSDVGYDAFLINGKRDSQLIAAKKGERVRIRVINAGSSSYFYLSLGQTPIMVIAADGNEIVPVQAKEVLLGMAETYDILFTVPENKSYELRATSQDGSGFSSAWIGQGEKVPAPDRPKPDLYAAMDHSQHAGHEGHASHAAHEGNAAPIMDHSKMDHASMDHAHMDHSKMNHASALSVNTLTVDGLMAPESTAFPASAPLHEVKLALGGDMDRYIWFINGKAIHQDTLIEIHEGELVRFVFENETMMHHPMHLHGHFFRVLNGMGDRSPLKHTVDVPPHGSRTIEFLANEPGQWMLHCHNLYHMHNGMARVVKYLSYKPLPEMEQHAHHDPHLHDHLYWQGALEASSNHGKALFKLSKTWDTFELKGETREEHGHRWEWEGDLFYRRWFSQFFNLVGGGTSFKKRQRATAGASYTLPFLVEAQLLVDHAGEFRGDLHRRFQWSSAIFSDAEFTFRQKQTTEFEISLMYGPNWHWAVGVMLTEEKIGAGLEWRF